MEILRNTKFQIMAALFVLFVIGIAIYAKFAGLLLILSLIIFGSLSIIWKEKEIKLAGLGALVLLSLVNIGINGMKFGIDFSGGTRIPVILEHSVSQETMNEIVQTIKKRASILGLTEVKVRAVGDTEINVEIPGSDESQVKFIEEILSHQGVFQGIVDGKIALTGENIYATSIRPLTAQELQAVRNDWGVAFSINKEGGESFAKAVKGKANYPLYMFLDMPNDAVVFISRAELLKNAPATATEEEITKAVKDALRFEEDGKTQEILVYIIEDIQKNINNGNNTDNSGAVASPATNKTKAIISENTAKEVKEFIKNKGFSLLEFEDADFIPIFEKYSTGYTLQEWKAVGLLSAPVLSPKITEGIPSYNYQIGGNVRQTGSAKTLEIQENIKRIESILKGGSLPVQISLGSRTTLPPSLGGEFLKLSVVGIVSSLIAISVLIGLRYKHVKAILPIVAISISELIILLSILGSFTIDLAAMAGIIAAIGVGVDAQIVITDEILKKDEHKLEEKMEHAFGIIKTNVVVAIVAMVPLLFSGLVEVIGFSISTILGSLLGFMISRPAYAVIVGKILD